MKRLIHKPAKNAVFFGTIYFGKRIYHEILCAKNIFKELLKNKIPFKYCDSFCKMTLRFQLERLSSMDDDRIRFLHQYFKEGFMEIYMPEMTTSSSQSRKRKYQERDEEMVTVGQKEFKQKSKYALSESE